MTVFGYGGRYPGDTLIGQVDTPVEVTWRNSLPERHVFSVDSGVHGVSGVPEVRTVVHLHGAHVGPGSDGFPDDWYAPGGSATFRYPNDQRATTLWYHDHALGIVRLNVHAGLAGFYLLRGPEEDGRGLPAGSYEVPLMLQDKTFVRGQVRYPDPPVVTEFFGDANVVNGKVWPVLRVEPRRYRLRLLNAANARFYRLRLLAADDAGRRSGVAGPLFHQVGSDGGLLPDRPEVGPEVLLAPAERADVIVDFASFVGQTLVLANDAPTPFPDGPPPPSEGGTGDVLLIKVDLPLAAADRSRVPTTLPSVSWPGQPAVTRDLYLLEARDARGLPQLVFGSSDDPSSAQQWHDPATETPSLGSVEQWNLHNTTADAHPIHLHLVQFQIVGREREGWKDTVRVDPNGTTSIRARFDVAGRYVWHCHILEHEDHDMMRPLVVT